MPSIQRLSNFIRGRLINTLKSSVMDYFGPHPPGFPAIPPHLFRASMNLLNTTLSMTKTSSHIVFLHTCQRRGIIPKGLKVSLFLSNPDPAIGSKLSRMSKQTSLQLLNIQLNSLRAQQLTIRPLLFHHKVDLRQACNLTPQLYVTVIGTIRSLNQQMFEFLVDTKDRKLKRLMPIHDHEYEMKTCTVFTIPEDLPLSATERSVLEKGLSFAPSSKFPDIFQFRHETERLFRRLRLKAMYAGAQSDRVDSSPAPLDILSTINRQPSSFTPASGKFPSLDSFINTCRERVHRLSFRPVTYNLSLEESQAIRTLRKRQDIVIKPADKGGATVVWNKDLYIKEALSQLNDLTYYSPLDEDPTPDYQEQVSTTIEDYVNKGTLPASARNLIEKFPRTSVFYLVPKIHKLNLPGRPIVSACSCPTVHISTFVDHILQPLVQSLPSFLKDTNSVLQKLASIEDPSIITCITTFDIKSLYTVIPHDDGLVAVRYFLDKREILDPPTQVVIRLTELVLKFTGFKFLDKFYTQTCGVAMGTKLGPSYANLFVGYFEELFFSEHKNNAPSFYGRYIDDGLMLFTSAAEEKDAFLASFSLIHPSLEFTFQSSSQSVSFLDIVISLNNGCLSTSVYNRPTNAYNYLQFRSCHPQHVIKSIPFSQFVRLRRLCSKEQDFHNKANLLRSHFLNRGYPTDVLAQARKAATSMPQAKVLHVDPDGSIPAVFTFHPSVIHIKKILCDNFPTLKEGDDTKDIFRDARLLFSYKKRPTLRSSLVHSAERSTNSGPAGTHPCGRPRCKTCKHVSSNLTVCTPKMTYNIKGSFTCTSTHVIYCISCNKCPNVHYVGETQNRLAERFTQHRFDITHNNPTTGVCRHFNLPDHGVKDCSIRALKVCFRSAVERRTAENKLIFLLGTTSPSGMNDSPRYT